MEKDNTFFKEAAELFNAPDLFVAETAKALYHHMLAHHAQGNFSPVSEFNILYFFQSVVHLRLLGSTEAAVASKEYLGAKPIIKTVNVPNDLRKPFLKDYVSIVTADSDSSGSNFDVAYAVAIVESAIEPNLELKPVVERPVSDEDFDDYWLSGFNS